MEKLKIRNAYEINAGSTIKLIQQLCSKQNYQYLLIQIESLPNKYEEKEKTHKNIATLWRL